MEERPTLPPERGANGARIPHCTMKTCFLVEAYSIGYVTDDLLFMPDLYSIASYPTVKIS